MADKISEYAAAATIERFDGDMTGPQARSIRERLGLSEEWLAVAAGVKLHSLDKWEHSSKAVPYEAANTLFEVFQRTRHAVLAVEAELASGDAVGPIATYANDDTYLAGTDGVYSAAWHRSAAGRIDEVTRCGLIYV